MAEIDLATDTYTLRIKDGEVVYLVDAFELVGAVQKLNLKPEDPISFEKIVELTRGVLKSEPPEAAAQASDTKVFAIQARVNKFMDSVGNA